MRTLILCIMLSALLGMTPCRASAETSDKKNNRSPVKFEFEIDAYYSAFDLFISLTNTPIPEAGEKPEHAIYRDLLLNSLHPRFVVLEASINPMPMVGVFTREHMANFYDEMQFSPDFNLVQAVTAGFEEPYAFSLFLGNVVKFKKPGEKDVVGNKGWVGYLLSHGDYHIKDNELIYDKWYEFEWKIKGDREFPSSKLSWSFRVGAKYHDHPDIKDVIYISLRRSRLEYNKRVLSLMDNSAFEYTYDMDSRNFDPVQHKFFVEKKFPNKKLKTAFTMALGFIWDSGKKYSGALTRPEVGDNYQVIIRPNIEF